MTATYHKTVLENGMRVVTERIPEMRSISVGVLAQVGPYDDPPGQEGMAHLLEHMFFQGTSNRSVRDIALMTDLIGGQTGGFTTRDYTCYYANVLDEHFPYALDLLGDLLLNSIFPEDQLAREKEAIVQEIRGVADSPLQRVQHLLKGTIWPDHPQGRPVTGSVESVAGLSREDLIYFNHRHYTPDRLVVVAAGCLDHGDFAAQARDVFWRMMGETAAQPRAAAAPRAGVALAEMDVGQAYFAFGLPAPAFAHADRYAFHVLTSLLGQGISSRLYRKLREETGLVYYVEAEYQAYRNDGLLVIEGVTSPDELTTVCGLVLQELAGLGTGRLPVSDEELWKAKTQLRSQHLLAAESTHTRMSRLATQELYFDRCLSSQETLASIEGIGQETLSGLAERFLGAGLERVALGVVGPASCSRDALNDLVDTTRSEAPCPSSSGA